jgi:hypothetical protein
MVSAFLLIECNHGAIESVLSNLVKLGPEIIYKIAGTQYDIITRIHADNKDRLKKLAAEIRDLENIRSTLSLIILTH